MLGGESTRRSPGAGRYGVSGSAAVAPLRGESAAAAKTSGERRERPTPVHALRPEPPLLADGHSDTEPLRSPRSASAASAIRQASRHSIWMVCRTAPFRPGRSATE